MSYAALISSLNPYFTGLSILITNDEKEMVQDAMSQSLFYWIIYSYFELKEGLKLVINVSILILLDYLFLLSKFK